MLRLQVLLARAGVGSRRACEQLITDGKVKLNGKTVTQLGVKASPDDHISVDGKTIRLQKPVYIAFFKPRGVLCTNSDPFERKTSLDFLKNIKERVYTIGRLDMDSVGLVLLTNDGNFAQYLTHPSHELVKEYEVYVKQELRPSDFENLQKEIYIGGKKTQPLKLVSYEYYTDTKTSKVIVQLAEGKNRQIRRVFEVAGFEVVKLKRTKIGTLGLGDLRPGQHRKLTDKELAKLYPAAEKAKTAEKFETTTAKAEHPQAKRAKTRKTQGRVGRVYSKKTAGATKAFLKSAKDRKNKGGFFNKS